MNIEITGLNKEQKRLLDIMWNLPTTDDLNRWRNNLPKHEYQMSLVLEELLKAAFLEELIQTEDDTSFALEEINRIKAGII
jgi:hypothetical protein